MSTPATPAAEERMTERRFKFDLSGPPEGFETVAEYTAASAEPATDGARSCLRVCKPDMCGFFRLHAPWTPARSGTWYRVDLDVKTVERLPYACFAVTATERTADGAGKTHSHGFDDGIQRPTPFGGVNPTPHTMGAWQRTRAWFKTSPDARELRLQLVVYDGAQTLLLDKLCLTELGAEEPRREAPLVHDARIDAPYGAVKLDMLVPGCEYEVELGYAPSREPVSDRLDPLPPDGSGMGLTLRSRDYLGRWGEITMPPEIADTHGVKTYRFRVPDPAVAVHLELFNDDMLPMNVGLVRQHARVFTFLRVRLRSLGAVVADNAYQYYTTSRQPSETLRPRQYLAVTDIDVAAIDHALQGREAADCELVRENGGMVLHLGGQRMAPMFHSYHPNVREAAHYDELARHGEHLAFAFYPEGGVSTRSDWSAPEEYDFPALDASVYHVLRQDPEAWVVIAVPSLYPPVWWGDGHRSEIVRDQKGRLAWSPGPVLYQVRWEPPEDMDAPASPLGRSMARKAGDGPVYSGHFVYSTASESMKRDVGNFLRALRKHVESMPYGKAVIGYRLQWGYDTQWGGIVWDHGYDGEPHYGDYSEPMRRRFREFLQAKYESEERLQAAWQQDAVGFATADAPGIERRNVDQRRERTYFLDPARDAAVIDYRECEALCIGEMLRDWSRALDEAGDRRILILSYNSDISERCSGRAGGQLGNRAVMAEPAWDGGGGPSYEARAIGLAGRAGGMLDSYVLHGKTHLAELDHRLFPVARQHYCNNVLFESPRKTISVLRREYAQQMCAGSGSWTFAMGLDWFNHPLVAETIAHIRTVFDRVLEYDRASIAEAALFVGEHGKNIQGDARRGEIPKMLVSAFKATMAHAGFPIAQYRMEDLPAVAGRYRLFFFPFAYGLTEQERAWIDALKRDGNLLVFGYGAGYVGQRISIDGIRDLTGMRIEASEDGRLTMNAFPDTHAITKELKGFIGAGNNSNLEYGLPRFHVSDPDAVPLGYFAETNGAPRIAMALKDHGSWQSVYIGVIGMLPPELLRGLARHRGLPVYSAGNDVMFFNRSLVAIHANAGGKKTINLPDRYRCTSLWDDLPMGERNRIDREMPAGDNALYLLEPVGSNCFGAGTDP
jgi:hypothetical protein